MAGRPLVDISGQRFGRLLVLKLRAKGPSRGTKWLCECDCGERLVVPSVDLKTGDTKSCGCLRRYNSRRMMREMTLTHGDTQRDKKSGKQVLSPEYRAWIEMRYRCGTETAKPYKWYGDRGIKVCKRWDKYENFLADMGRRPSPKHSLDRTNNDRGYKPSNCRWATAKQQNNNRRRREQ